jgi:HK97 family phage portal protein
MLAAIIKALRRGKEPRYPSRAQWPISRPIAGIPITSDSVLTVSAVWACVRYLSQTCAVLPWRVMKESDRGSEPYPSHPVNYLIGVRPNPETSAFQFRETLTSWALRYGNGYAEIERNAVGLPAALWPIHPDRVEPKRNDIGALVYEVSNDAANKVTIGAGDMFHLRGYGDGPIGVNVMQYAAQSIGWAKATQIFGAAFFGNGATPSGVVSMKRPMTEAGLELLKKNFADLYQGPYKSNKTAFLDNEMEYKAISIEPEKSQFIETNQFQIEEICRWFGVPPHKIAHLLRATFSNIEHQSIEVVVDSLTPWVKRWEEEADYKLFGPLNRQAFFTKIYLQGLMRGDTVARASFYSQMRAIGVLSVNDIRALEDMQTLPESSGADKLVMQSQFTTLEKIGEDPPAPVAAPAIDPENQPAADQASEDQATSDTPAARALRVVGD